MALLVDIKKTFPDFSLDISFETDFHTLGLLGASGSGKSMTLRCIAGLVKPDRGRIILNDRVLFDSSRGIDIPVRERNIGFIFQQYALFPHLTVGENISFGLRKFTKEEKKRRVEEKIALVQLEGLENRYPRQLSGGQQQRVALARALVMEPEVLLLDEPFSALDYHLRSQLENQLQEILARYRGYSIFVSHQLEEVYRVCRNLLIFDYGKVTARGLKDEIFLRPPTIAAARLTGCQNISRARKIAANLVEALDWQCTVMVEQAVPEVPFYVGIRDHHLQLVDSLGMPNTFPCWLAGTSQSPSSVTMYLQLGQPAEEGKYHLTGRVSQDDFQKYISRPFPWYIKCNPENVFLSRGD
ncbi:MAG: sulfate/molybdate ABC transporter ATP-binding protein [Peptococcaceae bacterium]